MLKNQTDYFAGVTNQSKKDLISKGFKRYLMRVTYYDANAVPTLDGLPLGSWETDFYKIIAKTTEEAKENLFIAYPMLALYENFKIIEIKEVTL